MSTASSTPTTMVRAAGAVCWQKGTDGELRVLVVHRPKYDDWSWPKGKLDADELDPVAAVREVAEETGLNVRLGITLPTARYRLSEVTDKAVAYWAAEVPDGELPPAPRPDEVDRAEWVSVEEADRRLTRRGDRQQLRALQEADADGTLGTWPLVVVRHAAARPRQTWTKNDADRPLSVGGRVQAAKLADLMAAWQPMRVWSSPWKRCLDTVAPYQDETGVQVRTKNRLSEDGHRRNPRRVGAFVGSLLDAGRPVAVCTHRPVLGSILGTLAGNAATGMRGLIPARDPFLQPGEVLVAHVSRRSGRVVAVERHVA